jgi:hypothetical protein
MDRERNPLLEENFGKLFLDFTKLSFGSFILGGIMRVQVPIYIIVAIGFALTIVFGTIGLLLTSKRRK